MTASVITDTRDARPTARQRRQIVGAGAVAAAAVALAAAVLHLLVDWPGRIAPVAVGALLLVPIAAVAGAFAPVAAAADRVLVQVLSAAGFTVVVSAIYVVVVLGLGKAPTGTTDRQVLGLSMVAAAAAAIGYVPARQRLTTLATGFFDGAREAPDAVLRTFGSRMTRAIALDELLLQLVESLRKTLALVSAEIYTGAGEVLELAVCVPDGVRPPIVVTDGERAVVAGAGVSGNAWASVWLPTVLDARSGGPLRVAPISHGGDLLGLIVVARGASSPAFTSEDDLMLTELARQVGLALHNARLDTALQSTLDELRRQADELRASRARIVASGDAERRRVERNLHDGAQQHLVALAVNLRLARDIINEDPTAAAAMLDELAGSVHETIQELRDLAHGIYPPLLVDSGLAEALRAAANRSPLDVAVTAQDIGRYPAEVEAAVYFCCLEALQNAGKYAAGASVAVRAWADAGGLLFTVADDGPGFDPAAARGGQGFVNMADRLGAIGGSVRWDSEPGHGTVVRGSVPLDSLPAS
jgi:signal transduction histidine kinase